MSDEKTLCAVIVWKIENYSYCWHRRGEELYSPEVCIENLWRSRWGLLLYPNGVIPADYVSLYLSRENDDSPSEKINVRFEFAILDAKCSPYEGTTQYFSHVFEKYDEKGCQKFIRRNLLDEKKELCLPGNVLTVRVKIWCLVKNVHKPAQYLLRTRIPARECLFSWWLPSDSSEDTKIDITQSVDAEKTALITLKQVNRENKRYVEVVINGDFDNKCRWKCDIRFSDTKQKFLVCGDAINTSHLPYKKEFELQNTLNLTNNFKKEVNCTFAFISQDLLNYNEATIVSGCDNPVVVHEGTAKIPNKIDEKVCSLHYGIRQLYSEGLLSDFTIKVRDKSFKVHSQILAATSPVLSRMFQTNMKESNDKILELDDLNEDIVGKMLTFLYTDDIGELCTESARKLYYAGDKYEIPGLKKTASDFLESKMNTHNVCDLLEFADRHNDEYLKSTALEFVFRHEKDMILSNDLLNFSKKNPELFIEAAIEIANMRFS